MILNARRHLAQYGDQPEALQIRENALVAHSSYAKDQEQTYRAGLLASGYKRCLSSLPISIARQWQKRNDRQLTSYSSATASASHRLPYSIRLRQTDHPAKHVETFFLPQYSPPRGNTARSKYMHKKKRAREKPGRLFSRICISIFQDMDHWSILACALPCGIDSFPALHSAPCWIGQQSLLYV